MLSRGSVCKEKVADRPPWLRLPPSSARSLLFSSATYKKAPPPSPVTDGSSSPATCKEKVTGRPPLSCPDPASEGSPASVHLLFAPGMCKAMAPPSTPAPLSGGLRPLATDLMLSSREPTPVLLHSQGAGFLPSLLARSWSRACQPSATDQSLPSSPTSPRCTRLGLAMCYHPATPMLTRGFSSDIQDKSVRFRPLSLYVAPESVDSYKHSVYNKLHKFGIGIVKNDHLRQTLADDISLVKEHQFDIDNLQNFYYKLVRHIIVSSGLLVDEALDDQYLRALDAAFHDVSLDRQDPLYVSSLDLMRTLVSLNNSKWTHLLDFLRDSKILVTERWDVSICSIETMTVNHNLKLSLGCKIYYHGRTKASCKHKLANLCSVIWRDEQVFDCCICLDIKCDNNIEAELLAMYLLVRRGIDLEIEHLTAITENDHTDQVMREQIVSGQKKKNKKDVNNKKYEDLEIVLRGSKAYFKNFFCHREVRQKMEIPVSLSRIKTDGDWPKFSFETHLRNWSPLLQGLPIFQLHKKRCTIYDEFICKKRSGGTLTLDPIYKVNLGFSSRKIDVVKNLLLSMHPQSASLLVKEKKYASLVEEELKNIFPTTTVSCWKYEACFCIMMYQQVIDGADAEARHLSIIFDASISEMYHKKNKEICVKLIMPWDKEEPSIKDLRPECYLFFKNRLDIDT